jgi:hypothetical protein
MNFHRLRADNSGALVRAAARVATAARHRAASLDETSSFPIEDIVALNDEGLLLAPFPNRYCRAAVRPPSFYLQFFARSGPAVCLSAGSTKVMSTPSALSKRTAARTNWRKWRLRRDAARFFETAALWVERAAIVAETNNRSANAVVAYVNLARSAVEHEALRLLELVHRSVGLAAYMRPHPIELISRDLATYLRQSGPDRAPAGAAAWVLKQDRDVGSLWG